MHTTAIVSVMSVLSAITYVAHAQPIATPGMQATYVLVDRDVARPEYETSNQLTVVHATCTAGPVVPQPAGFQWFMLTFTRQNGQTYQAWLLMDGYPVGKDTPRVARYLWQEPDWSNPVEYVHETTGMPILPRYEYLWRFGLPKPVHGGKLIQDESFTDTVMFQGWSFSLKASATDVSLSVPDNCKLVQLNPDLLIGFIERHDEMSGKHLLTIDEKDYDWQDTTEQYWREMIDAGFNLFHGANTIPSWIWQEPVFVNTRFQALNDWPAHLYRSNFFGRAIYVDEPAIHLRGRLNTKVDMAHALTHLDAAKALEKQTTAPMYVKSGNYSVYWINTLIKQQFNPGNVQLQEDDIYVWEAIWPTAWYQQAGPYTAGAGLVDEDIYHENMVESYNMAFGTEIPATVYNACTIRIAVARGTARNFDKNWGTAVYAYTPQSLQPRTDQAALRYMYHAGAQCFWFWQGWPGMNVAHVPLSYKRAYADTIRQAYREHPNRDMKALQHAARACIALPYGYTFSPRPMFGVNWLHLERINEHGVTYRQVLASAATEVERYIRMGIPFDIAIDEPRFKPDGYEEIVYIQEDATLRIMDNQGVERRLTEPRVLDRPDLGPHMAIHIEPVDVPAQTPCTVTFKARVDAGGGERATDLNGKPMLHWWLYRTQPELRYCHEMDTDEIDTCKVDLEKGGTYHLRASTADVFGRPAVTWYEFTLTDTVADTPLSGLWHFRLDPDNAGVQKKWFASDTDFSQWSTVPVPQFWEEHLGRPYDGYAWYATTFDVPDGSSTQTPVYLRFEGIDEQAWVYVNGEYLGERTVESTGRPAVEFWDAPCTFTLPTDLPTKNNLLVVRVRDSSHAGGIYKPVRLMWRIHASETGSPE